jgi:hypothetical protein
VPITVSLTGNVDTNALTGTVHGELGATNTIHKLIICVVELDEL